jgi:putative membrane protein
MGRGHPSGLAIFAILGQVSWILVPASARASVTIGTVIAFFLASATHAYIARGVAWASTYLAITLVGSLAIEVLGVYTQFPFGNYAYASTLGPALFGVPLLIPLAWAMMA